MNGKTPDLVALRKKTEQLRYNLIAMMDYAGSGHPGGSLSVLKIMTSLYYDGFLKVDAKNPQDPDRDRFVISKGHASPTQYVILADLGYYGKDKLRVFDKNNSMLPKHCNRKLTPGVDALTGALGQGMSMAVGMALAARADDAKYRTYCVLGDGECQSGEIWEAAMSAAKYKLGNLKVIVDNNLLQIDGFSDDIMPLGDQRAKWSAFGWHVEVCDGHMLQPLQIGRMKVKNRIVFPPMNTNLTPEEGYVPLSWKSTMSAAPKAAWARWFWRRQPSTPTPATIPASPSSSTASMSPAGRI